MNRTGGGAPSRFEITDLDRRIMTFINVESSNGIIDTNDSGLAAIGMDTQPDLATVFDEGHAPATPPAEEYAAIVVAEPVPEAGVAATIAPPVAPPVTPAVIPAVAAELRQNQYNSRLSRPTMSVNASQSTDTLNSMRKTLGDILKAQLAGNRLAEITNQLLAELLRAQNGNNSL